jgi:hypothetical protein
MLGCPALQAFLLHQLQALGLRQPPRHEADQVAVALKPQGLHSRGHTSGCEHAVATWKLILSMP